MTLANSCFLKWCNPILILRPKSKKALTIKTLSVVANKAQKSTLNWYQMMWKYCPLICNIIFNANPIFSTQYWRYVEEHYVEILILDDKRHCWLNNLSTRFTFDLEHNWIFPIISTRGINDENGRNVSGLVTGQREI